MIWILTFFLSHSLFVHGATQTQKSLCSQQSSIKWEDFKTSIIIKNPNAIGTEKASNVSEFFLNREELKNKRNSILKTLYGNMSSSVEQWVDKALSMRDLRIYNGDRVYTYQEILNILTQENVKPYEKEEILHNLYNFFVSLESCHCAKIQKGPLKFNDNINECSTSRDSPRDKVVEQIKALNESLQRATGKSSIDPQADGDTIRGRVFCDLGQSVVSRQKEIFCRAKVYCESTKGTSNNVGVTTIFHSADARKRFAAEDPLGTDCAGVDLQKEACKATAIKVVDKLYLGRQEGRFFGEAECAKEYLDPFNSDAKVIIPAFPNKDLYDENCNLKWDSYQNAYRNRLEDILTKKNLKCPRQRVPTRESTSKTRQ